jgi:site-specific recombinase XerD
MRLSELTNLTNYGVDLDAGVAFVMGKDVGRGPVPFGPRTATSLDKYIQMRARSVKSKGTDALWVGSRGAIGTAGVRTLIERHKAQAGIGRGHAHLFHHYLDHQCLAEGGNEGDLMSLVGWRSRELLNRYAGSAADERAHAACQRGKPPGDRLRTPEVRGIQPGRVDHGGQVDVRMVGMGSQGSRFFRP